jgi:pilus assembly protein Flp/PilA
MSGHKTFPDTETTLTSPRSRSMTAITLTNLRRFARDDRGATVIEYALIAGVLAIVIISTLQSIAASLVTTFDQVNAGFK